MGKPAKSFEQFEEELASLVDRFSKNLPEYKGPEYNEARLRDDFLNPLFSALGWDVSNRAGLIQSKREVEIESATRIGSAKKRADYLFRADGRNRFVCEAKKPREDLGKGHVFQVKRYAWNKDLPFAVLTDFEEIKFFIVGSRPDSEEPAVGEFKTLHFSDYAKNAQVLWDHLSHESIAGGFIDRLIDDLPKKAAGKGKMRQGYLIKPDRNRALDVDFLNFLDEARKELASSLVKHNDREALFTDGQLNAATQKILDRILFLRICEDRDIDTGVKLPSLVDTWAKHTTRPVPNRQTLIKDEEPLNAPMTPGESLYRRIVRHFRELDRRPPSTVPFFNGQLFKKDPSEDLEVGDDFLINFIRDLSDENSPYLFNVIPVEILGSVYERFLGKVVRPQGRGITVEEKPEVRKAGGVYYTPRYIVDYIVEQTVGKLLDEAAAGKDLKAFSSSTDALRFLDPACGSGSFLIRAFERTCEHWEKRFTDDLPPQKDKEERAAWEKKHRRLCWVDPETNSVHLTVELKRQILTRNIYGVDLDSAAVEVTQLSLYLKMLENENRTTLQLQREFLADESDIALLPPLQDNIKCGNSLIASDFSMMPEELVRVNAFDWPVQFAPIMKAGGFNAVIGNPPYGASLDESHKGYLNQSYSFQSYQLDSYLLFMERSLRDLVCMGGFYGMIIPNPWLTNLLQTTTRRYVCENCRIHEIVHFKFPVFPGVTVDTEVVVFEKGIPTNWTARVRVVSEGDKVGEPLLALPCVTFLHAQEKWRKLDGGVLNIFTSEAEEALAAKIFQRANRLDLLCDINVGIKPYQVGKGEPKQTRQIVDTRPFDSDRKVSKRHRTCLRGSDIGRYLIAPLEPRFLDYGPWLAEPRPAANFNASEKIFMRQTGDSLVATLDTQQFICLNNMHVIVQKYQNPSLKFLLGLLNSRVLNWYYHILNPEVGEALAEVKRTNVAQLPVLTLDLKNPTDKFRHDKIVSLVDKMLALMPSLRAATAESEKAVLQNAVTATDQQIDTLVYDLYGLTPEEITLVESSA